MMKSIALVLVFGSLLLVGCQAIPPVVMTPDGNIVVNTPTPHQITPMPSPTASTNEWVAWAVANGAMLLGPFLAGLAIKQPRTLRNIFVDEPGKAAP